MSQQYIAVDLGGTNGRVGLYEGLFGSHQKVNEATFRITRDFEDDFHNLVLTIRGLTASRPSGISLAIAGKTDHGRQTIIGAGNLTHWVGKPIAKLLEKEFECKVVLGNDAEAGGMAEALTGHGQKSDFLYLCIGTGLGGCYVRRHGERVHPYAGEIGHIRTGVATKRQCGCGYNDCLESHVSGDGLKLIHDISPEKLRTRQWEDASRKLARGLHSILTTAPVPLIVLGGGVVINQPQLVRMLEREFHREGMLTMVEPPITSLTAHGDMGGVEGALALLSVA